MNVYLGVVYQTIF